MTRVDDALVKARARAREAGAAVAPDIATESKPLPLDAVAELWPTETLSARARERHPQASSEVVAGTLTRADTTPVSVPAGASSVGAESVRAERLVTAGGVERLGIEQYRRLAARLYIAQAERGTRVVMVTSPLVGDGKTLTATNLALTLSESYGKRVLLIDADLRRPWIHELFGVPNVTGLNDGIRSDAERKVPLIRLSEHLSLLTAGRPDPDPMSVFSSERMKRVLEDASAAFDWVIIDTPPVALLSDAHLLASLVDGVVLVIRAGSTPLQAIKAATEAVGRDRILGVVLNCAERVTPATNYKDYGSRGSALEKDQS